MLAAILVGYGVLATAYAVRTPDWQAPDEPAHYNYVAQLAADPLHPPRIAPGDWDAERLEALKAARFPPEASIDGIAYEDHQPPAYYYLAVPAWRAARGALPDRLRAVRLLGVALGLITVTASFVALRALVPDDPALALAGTGFVAFLPMQLAVTSAANNDALANAVAASALALAALRLGGRTSGRFHVAAGGVLGGLALLTKLTVAPTVALLGFAELLRASADGRLRAGIGRVAALGALAGAIAAPWAWRNARVYGGNDLFGLQAHDLVVVGQARTAAWIVEHGLGAYVRRAAVFTFESFWGVFGWMGVFLDRRIYAALALVVAVAAVGALGWAMAAARDPERAHDRRAAALMAAACAVAVTGFAWYNATYVQHQGRYLFAALPAWAGFMMLGVRQVAEVIGGRLVGEAQGRAMGKAAMLGLAMALAGLAWLALDRYVVPGLG